MKKKLSELMLPAPVGGGFEMEDYWVWCGSVIKGEDGQYHMFASRWPKTYPMHPGWLLASEIVRASCDKPDGKYQFEEVVLPARGPQFWDGRMTHCPQIMKIDNQYILFYTGTTHPFDTEPESCDKSVLMNDPRVVLSRANKRVGIAVSNSIFGPWKRYDKPLLTTRPEEFDNFLISNATPCVCPDGKILVVYKTRSCYAKCSSNGCATAKHSPQVFGAVKLDYSGDGYYVVERSEQPILPNYSMEDPFIWYDEDGYNLMAKDMTGKICGEKWGGFYADSPDGMHWTLKEKSLFYSRRVLWSDGIVHEMGNLERSFLLFEDGKPTHAFFAASDGKNGEGFCNCSKTWNMVIPLKA